MPEPTKYADIINRYRRGQDFLIETGNRDRLDQCLLVAPHGGGTEPGSSELMRSVANLWNWAWYDFSGLLLRGNREAFHLTSTSFDEPELNELLSLTQFAISFHGAVMNDKPIVYVGGKWQHGREVVCASINKTFAEHKIQAVDAITSKAASHIRGLEDCNLTNRGRLSQGIQLEFSRGARNLIFPPDASHHARTHPTAALQPLAVAIHTALERLCEIYPCADG